ncbi:efflux transporter, outer membrane factor (OMF) lipo, NodT family protein [Burkholderia mallei NCTC 10247]|nr:putative membrane protein [Burkholderia mallei SAVP1]AIO53063.1 efflux transporter, outer membrane factor (OMF) lipo, NodT family protein [Burkholderia mallei]AIS29719.1 efflux transporter, outer membrane factor (OMF) lipo, NodT family protein [Burkholderia mallei NCTC 10247]EEP86460.1 TrpC [Burkholderia mallei GB8 horse 4]EES44556.1 TrpC [Burkholderia mallei PRL-20]
MRRALTRWRLSFALGALAALASACTVGPDFHPPRADVPAQWHDVTATSTSSTSSASSAASPPAAGSGAPNAGAPPRSLPTVEADPDPRWWRTFGDPVLDRLVERAAQDNLDVQAAVLRIAEARAQVRAAAAQGLPDVRASASYQREQLGLKGFLEDGGVDAQLERLGAPGSPLERIAPGAGAALRRGAEHTLDQLTSPVNLWQAGFDASWELDLFGRVRRSVEAAGAQTQAAIEGRNDALLSLEAEVAQTYLQLRGAQALRALADEQRDVVALTRDQARKGLSSELDVQSADARLAQLRAQLPQFDQQIALLRNGLSYLLGDAPGALDDALREPRALPELPPTVPIGLPSTLARRRPDIRRAEAQLHAATAGVGVAVAQFYPDVSLTGQVGTRASSRTGRICSMRSGRACRCRSSRAARSSRTCACRRRNRRRRRSAIGAPCCSRCATSTTRSPRTGPTRRAVTRCVTRRPPSARRSSSRATAIATGSCRSSTCSTPSASCRRHASNTCRAACN